MDRSSFAVGAVFGAVVYASVNMLLFDSRLAPEVEAPAPPASSEVRERTAAPPSEEASEIQESDSVSTLVEERAAPSGDTDPAGRPKEQIDFYSARRAALLEEPKDESWAYFAEQAMLQYLANHPAMSGFSVDYVECRTTQCQIGVEAYAESANPDWQRIIYDMRDQPWYEFGQVGTSSGELDGRQLSVTSLRRTSTQ